MDALLAPSFPLFLAAALLLAVTPGPGLAYVVARTALAGRRAGMASCAGTAVGGLAHVLAGALGLSLLVAQSAWAFSIVKYLGAAYLIYLGIRTLRARGAVTPVEATPAVHAHGARRAFGEGVVVELLNVKTALFFLAFIPQFVDASAAPGPQFVLLGAVCVALNTAVDVLAVLLAERLLRSDAARGKRAQRLHTASGLSMIGLGLYLALVKPQR